MNNNQFKCEMCQEIFLKSRSDEEAHEECVNRFGSEVANNDEMAIICDDCFNKLDLSEKELNRYLNEYISKRN